MDSSASSEEQQARKLMAEADKKSSGKSGGLLSGVFGGGSAGKIDEAIDLYCKAANFFKMAKNWPEAGNCFAKAASLNSGSGNKLEACLKFSDASNCFRKVDPTRSLDCLRQVVSIQTEMGRFAMAAKTLVSMAEICEGDLKDIPQAMIHYEKAADYFQGEENKSQAQPCLLKVAQYAADGGNYTKAIEIFEQVAQRCAENPMLKAGAREYYFKAALCHLSVDPLNAEHAMTRYAAVFPAVQDSREMKLLKKILEYVEASDLDAFEKALEAYDEVGRMDPWASSVLLRVKRGMGNDDLT